MRVRLFVASLVVITVGCEPPPPEEWASEEAPAQAPFNDPDSICRALTAQGMPPALSPVWKYQEPLFGFAPYSCVADDYEVTPGNLSYVGDVANVIEYSAESQSEDRVESIRLSANIFNERNEEPAVVYFLQLTPALFEQLGLTMPDGLLDAIERGESQSFEMDYGTVSLTRDDSYRFGHGRIVTIEPA
jgi:hypothetical protein